MVWSRCKKKVDGLVQAELLKKEADKDLVAYQPNGPIGAVGINKGHKGHMGVYIHQPVGVVGLNNTIATGPKSKVSNGIMGDKAVGLKRFWACYWAQVKGVSCACVWPDG